MPDPRQLLTLKLLLPLTVMLAIAGSALAQPGLDAEQADVVRQLNESRQRVRQLEERLRSLELRRAQAAAASMRTTATNCTTPFTLDLDGVKHLRPECLAVDDRVSCESSPFALDADGIKRVRPACNR